MTWLKRARKDIESKISAAISENMKYKSKDEAQNQSDIKNEGLLKTK